MNSPDSAEMRTLELTYKSRSGCPCCVLCQKYQSAAVWVKRRRARARASEIEKSIRHEAMMVRIGTSLVGIQLRCLRLSLFRVWRAGGSRCRHCRGLRILSGSGRSAERKPGIEHRTVPPGSAERRAAGHRRRRLHAAKRSLPQRIAPIHRLSWARSGNSGRMRGKFQIIQPRCKPAL